MLCDVCSCSVNICLTMGNMVVMTLFELTRKKKFIVFTLVNGSQNFEAGNANFLFERFYRSDNDSNKSGFGIGLSIAKAIVENHHGKINAECIEGKEIKFTVMLPYTK